MKEGRKEGTQLYVVKSSCIVFRAIIVTPQDPWQQSSQEQERQQVRTVTKEQSNKRMLYDIENACIKIRDIVFDS